MKGFFRYLNTKHRLIAAFISCAAIFLLSFYLYHLPLKAAIYPSCLALLILIAFVAVDYKRLCDRRAELAPIRDLDYDLVEAMPRALDELERDYQNIIKSLKDEHVRLMDLQNASYNDMISYYTVWAHQIKTPIAAMRLRLQSEDTELTRSLKLDLDRIESYVEMVLTYLRLESRDSDYVIKKHKLDDIIRPSIRKYAGEFIDRKLSLSYEGICESVLTDDKWLAFIIEQLLSNALKYTKEGAIRIYFEEPSMLCIEDSGIGIAKEDLPRIFENGYTGFNGRSDRRASGIGLYLCKRIANNLGCEIKVESKLGSGSKFMIAFGDRNLEIE